MLGELAIGSPDVVVRTYNSGTTLSACLDSVVKFIPGSRIIVIDHNSSDDTLKIAHSHGAQIVTENSGLGRATTLGISLVGTSYVLFVDSDITIIRPDFLSAAMKVIILKRTGAVVGLSSGHPFAYGLPLGLTLLDTEFARNIRIPDDINGRETYYIQREVRRLNLRVRYISDSMIHNSTYRSMKHWPEWQGSQVRITAGLNIRELAYSCLVIFLMLSNSKSIRNLAFFPIFTLKFLIGYTNPGKWSNLDRRPNDKT